MTFGPSTITSYQSAILLAGLLLAAQVVLSIPLGLLIGGLIHEGADEPGPPARFRDRDGFFCDPDHVEPRPTHTPNRRGARHARLRVDRPSRTPGRPGSR